MFSAIKGTINILEVAHKVFGTRCAGRYLAIVFVNWNLVQRLLSYNVSLFALTPLKYLLIC